MKIMAHSAGGTTDDHMTNMIDGVRSDSMETVGEQGFRGNI